MIKYKFFVDGCATNDIVESDAELTPSQKLDLCRVFGKENGISAKGVTIKKVRPDAGDMLHSNNGKNSGRTDNVKSLY